MECDTLEDVCRQAKGVAWAPEMKVQNQTCIPFGLYEVVLTWSNRFQRILPLVLGVPSFEGIRIHPGNDDVDTDGCILVGTRGTKADWISDSRRAFGLLFIQLEGAARKEKIHLQVIDGR